jgi:phosphatidylinositol alpha-mannosyltransferase
VLAKSIAGSIQPFIKSVTKHLSEVTAVSKAATSYVGAYVADEHIHFIPNGVDLDAYTPAKKGTIKKDILYVGRLEKRKGVKYLIDAYSILQQTITDQRLIIAGDGPDKEKLIRLVDEYGLHDKVDFLGFVTEDEKKKLLRECALFVSPALYGESFGIVLIEAMASGAVVIGGNNIGYASVLSGRGATGLVNPLDAELFASRLELLLTDEDLRTLWLAWAAEDVKKYSYKHIVKSYENIYKNLVKK